jgi:VCBS repeat-containing protein
VAEVYDVQAVQALAGHKLTQDAGQSLSSSYVPVGQILANVVQASSDKHGTILLTVSALGVWAYQFTDAQRAQLARLIAGKNSQDARALLLKQPGVYSVTITLTGVGVTVVPGDAGHITVNISAVQGLHS